MDVGYRLRSIREQKKLSQEEVVKRTGLIRSYISRVENGHTVPSVATMEKMARAHLRFRFISFYTMMKSHLPPSIMARVTVRQTNGDSSGKGGRFVNKLCQSLARMSERDRQVLMLLARILKKTPVRVE